MDIRKIIREILREEFIYSDKIVSNIKDLGFQLNEKKVAYGYNSYYFFRSFDELEFMLALIIETKGGEETLDGKEPEEIVMAMMHTADKNRETHHLFTKQVKNTQQIEDLVLPYIEKFQKEEEYMFLGIKPQAPISLDKMERSDLLKMMDKALDKKDFASAQKIGQYIRQ